jgi:predicted amidohydrolase
MKSNVSRRQFITSASLALGAGAIGSHTFAGQPETYHARKDAPTSVNVGTVSIMDITALSPDDMVQKVLKIMESMIPFQPDIICLPEVFAYTNITGIRRPVKEVAEKAPGHIVNPFLSFAAANKCYVICPTYTLAGGNIYISAVLIDRKGKVVGEYHKMRPTDGEMETGVKPGESDPPVFDTDFGKIGIQICFDIKYEDGWNALKEKGAEIIFWPSAYAGGKEISSRAWRHQVFIVSSTQKDTSKICDISGETITQTNRWQRNWACAPVNLQKAFIPTWPAVSLFPKIQKKYGRKIAISTFSEEEWTIIESLDKDIKIADVLHEYKLKTMYDTLKELASVHHKARLL